MEKVVLTATKRSVTGKQVRALRRQGKLPAVMYGRHFDATPITLESRETGRLLSGLTASSIITINLDGKEHSVLLQERQRDFIKGTLLHIDFRVVSMDEKIRTHVAIELSGLAPAVKDYNGIVITGLNELEVEALPKDLPERFVVDLSKLKHIGDSITVKDIKVSDNIKIFDEKDEMIIVIVGSATEGEEAPVVAEITGVEEPEVIEKGKKEEENTD